MDTLSPLLARLRLSSGLFSRAELQAPWGIATRGTRDAIFHVILQGEGWLCTEDAPPVPVRAGELVILLAGQAHALRDDPGSFDAMLRDLPREIGPDGLPVVRCGGSGRRTSILCGNLAFPPDNRDFLRPLLPPLLHVRDAGPTAAWLDQTLRLMAAEVSSGRPGSGVILARLADILVIQALRASILGPNATGWLAALGDPQIQRALAAIHAEPARPWTAADLARQAGMSRAAFFARFSEQIGEPPAAYLLRWRMALARQALREGGRGLSQVAEQVGYTSEAAFCRAFRRQVGASPAAWRRAQRAA